MSVLHFVVPQLLDTLPEEVKNAVVVRRELYTTGACSTCNRRIPTGDELERFNEHMRIVNSDLVRESVLKAYYSHEKWCRGHEDRFLAIAKRNGLRPGAVRWSLVSFDVDTRELKHEALVPEGMSLEDIVQEYRRLVEQGGA